MASYFYLVFLLLFEKCRGFCVFIFFMLLLAYTLFFLDSTIPSGLGWGFMKWETIFIFFIVYLGFVFDNFSKGELET